MEPDARSFYCTTNFGTALLDINVQCAAKIKDLIIQLKLKPVKKSIM